jgi:3'(2'), 5'-bisphosphate nucleotidase
MEQTCASHRIKADGTPTTSADLAAEELIIAGLRKSWPDVPVVAEETASSVCPKDLFFLVDPLDGTSEFIRGTGEYSVNIAAVAGDRPIAAAICAPVLGRIWIAGQASAAGQIAERASGGDAGSIQWHPIHVRPAPDDGLVALVSRRHGDPATETCLSALPVRTRRTASSALKFCLIADGEADVYVRCGPTMEWDTAAGDHILSRAGGAVIGPSGQRLTYGHDSRGYLNGPFAALGDEKLAAKLTLPATAA